MHHLGCSQAGVCQAAEAGAEDGSGRLEEASRPGTRLPVHRLRPERPVQLRRDATAGKKSRRTPPGSTAWRFFLVDYASSRLSGWETIR